MCICLKLDWHVKKDPLLRTGVLNGTVWGVPGSGSLEVSARAVLYSTLEEGLLARPCTIARPGAC
ncbi:hypothetical protein JCGZ_04553 [Jatropha curcas]|uniref:Uncharacterized protein n=1 Tax=Jatropha curcas TaxID=180498 RepID=A0A067LPZ4_JATCU|nr:hypothetical protein JCGZ_04553 [Jatropha curcas]